jgi:hypothetical protein
MLLLNDKIGSFILILLFLCIVSAICSGEEFSESDMMRLIADGYEDNLARLRTWTGSAVREAFNKDGTMKWSERLYFISDRDQKANLWRGNRNRESKEAENQITLNAGMNKGGYTYKMDFLGDLSGNLSELHKGTLLIYNEEEFPNGIYTPSFDPVWILTSTLGIGGRLGNALRAWGRMIEDNPATKGLYQITHEANKVKIVLYNPEDKKYFSLYVFDLKKGCSLVESHDYGANSESHWVVDYEEHMGVFVPSKMTSKLVSKEFNSIDTRNITFTTESVNEKISPSEFQYEKLGLRPGDFILDHSAGGLHYKWRSDDDLENTVEAVIDAMIHNDGKLVASQNQDKHTPEIDVVKALPTDDKVEQKQDKGRLCNSYIIIIAILAAIVICITMIKVLRRKK